MPVEAVFDPQVEIAQISQVIPNPLEKPVFTHLIPALQKNKLGWPSWLHSFQYRDIVPNEADVKHFAINTKIEDVPIRIERELVPNGSGNFVLEFLHMEFQNCGLFNKVVLRMYLQILFLHKYAFYSKAQTKDGNKNGLRLFRIIGETMNQTRLIHLSG